MMAVTERPSSLGNVLATNGLHATRLSLNSTSGRGYDDDPAAPGVDSAPHPQSNTKVFLLPGRILRAMKRAVFVGAILGCLAMFACAAALCGFLLVTGWLAPAHASFQQELFFDYTKTEAVASAHFCPTLESKGAVRILKPGQRASVWLELLMPDVNGDVFQVAAALLTLHGRMIESTSRPCLVPHRSTLVQYARMVTRLPVALIGWDTERQTVEVPLFKRFRESPDMPFCMFRAALQAHARGGEWPRLYSAIAHVDIELGYIGRALYWVRPSGWVRRILWVVALSAMAGSFLSLVILWLVYSLTSSARSRPKGASKEMKGSGSDEEVSSEEGASDQATGDWESQSERDAAESADDGDARDSVISPLTPQVLKKFDQRSVSQQSSSSDGYPAEGSAYMNGKKFA